MMKTAVALLACLTGANAFMAKTATPAAKTSLNSVWDEYYGGIDFKCQKFEFDPLNLAESYPEWVPWFRECEIRHGRTAMLAVTGFIATDFVRVPGDMYSFESIPKTIDAHDALLKSGPMYQLVMWIGLWDIIITGPAMRATWAGEREAGDYGLYQFAPKDEAEMQKKKESELLNGRLAMCAVGGIATQSIINGHGFPYL